VTLTDDPEEAIRIIAEHLRVASQRPAATKDMA
jgi:hypothetical protein